MSRTSTSSEKSSRAEKSVRDAAERAGVSAAGVSAAGVSAAGVSAAGVAAAASAGALSATRARALPHAGVGVGATAADTVIGGGGAIVAGVECAAGRGVGCVEGQPPGSRRTMEVRLRACSVIPHCAANCTSASSSGLAPWKRAAGASPPVCLSTGETS